MQYKKTKEIKVSKDTINQIIGQDEAVNIIKKAAKQRRHVLLIGKPRTTKSIINQADYREKWYNKYEIVKKKKRQSG